MNQRRTRPVRSVARKPGFARLTESITARNAVVEGFDGRPLAERPIPEQLLKELGIAQPPADVQAVIDAAKAQNPDLKVFAVPLKVSDTPEQAAQKFAAAAANVLTTRNAGSPVDAPQTPKTPRKATCDCEARMRAMSAAPALQTDVEGMGVLYPHALAKGIQARADKLGMSFIANAETVSMGGGEHGAGELAAAIAATDEAQLIASTLLLIIERMWNHEPRMSAQTAMQFLSGQIGAVMTAAALAAVVKPTASTN